MKKLIILTLVFLMLTLSSCGVIDTSVIMETKSPHLNASPVNGIWETSELIKNESRLPFEKGDRFYFNVDFIATEEEVYLSPEFEILTINWSSFQNERLSGQAFSEIANLDKVNLIHINANNQSLAEIILLSSDEMLIYINNQFLKLKRIQANITADEKNQIIKEYSVNNQIAKEDDIWGVLFGYKEYVYDEANNLPNYLYKTALIKYVNGDISIKNLDGVVLNNNGRIDKYTIIRNTEGASPLDELYLNNRKLNITDHNQNIQSRIFGLNYISNNYTTLEYYYSEANKLSTLSTYNTNFVDGISQLKSDDIIPFSSDRIVENITRSNSDSTLHDAIYNIGIFRENGLYVLKSRVVSYSNNTKFNRDITLSSNFTNANSRMNNLISFQAIKNVIPTMTDIYISPDGDYALVINQDKIELYPVDGLSSGSIIATPTSLPRNSTIVSASWVTNAELQLIDSENSLSFIK